MVARRRLRARPVALALAAAALLPAAVRAELQHPKLAVVHRNELGSSYVLVSATYTLDGSPLFIKADETGEFDKTEEVALFDQRIQPGTHQVFAQYELRGHGWGILSYLEGMRIKLRGAYTFQAEPGKISTVKAIVFERSGLTMEFKDRPGLRFDLKVSKEAPVRPPIVQTTDQPVAAGQRRPSSQPPSLEELEKRIAEARGRLALLRDLVEKSELTEVQRARDKFAEAETQFLLENYEGAAALLFDAIDYRGFRSEPSLPRALYYLGESLYRTGSYLESKRYFREAISVLPPGPQFQDAVVRLIDLADRTSDPRGIDDYFQAARAAGEPRPEVAYLYAKWTARRPDMTRAERSARADAEFARIRPDQPYHAQSLYFRGELAVEAAAQDAIDAAYRAGQSPAQAQEARPDPADPRLETAAGFFAQVRALAPDAADARRERVRTLAGMALARVRYEQGRFPEAVDIYRQIAQDAPEYNDAMFETAATYVRAGNYEQALKTSDILLMLGSETAVTPEAKILQANLQLQLGRFDRASATFREVSERYAPVRDDIRKMLDRPDPAAYFNDLLARSKDAMQIAELLPPAARPFLNTAADVERARRVSGELSAGRDTATAARKLGGDLVDTLDSSGTALFPDIQDAGARAVQLSNTLLEVERALVQIQVAAIEDDVDDVQWTELQQLEAERSDLDARFHELPRTEKDYEARRLKFSKALAARERDSFRVRKSIDALLAQVGGLESWLRQGQESRTLQPDQEEEATATVAQYRDLLGQLDEQRAAIDRAVKDIRLTLATEAAGGQVEEDFRTRYHNQLKRMEGIVASVLKRVDEAQRPLLGRASRCRTDIDGLQTELAHLRGKLRVKAVERVDDFRRQVGRELARLEDLETQVAGMEDNTRQIVGEIAGHSFVRLSRQFYDFVLKADVGQIDVAWARKKQRSDRISDLVKDRDAETKYLQDRFKDVLGDEAE